MLVANTVRAAVPRRCLTLATIARRGDHLAALRARVLHRRRRDRLRHLVAVDPPAAGRPASALPSERTALRRRTDGERVRRAARSAVSSSRRVSRSPSVPRSLLWVARDRRAAARTRDASRSTHPRTTTIRADIAEGLRFLCGATCSCASWRSWSASSTSQSSAVFTVFVLFAVGPASPMKLTDSGYGLLLTASAVGSVLGTFLAEPAERLLGRARSLALAHRRDRCSPSRRPAFTTNPCSSARGSSSAASRCPSGT